MDSAVHRSNRSLRLPVFYATGAAFNLNRVPSFECDVVGDIARYRSVELIQAYQDCSRDDTNRSMLLTQGTGLQSNLVVPDLVIPEYIQIPESLAELNKTEQG